ncbi:hypothetical protein Y032_0088g2201 [Ancylostoma ceylanicum]|uniref:CCHC-type domain-containing protein n=1 Tax=Ancylostoma ceylanicum TaxID=53326 RepID=A0A016TPQ4_9BILA|nr:hypothetical protein Y032_0088g2201 [Ancylostoma ceylanicum]
MSGVSKETEHQGTTENTVPDAQLIGEKEVGTKYKGLEEKIKELLKSVTNVRVVCEREVSGAFRLGDARKEAVVSAVDEQTKIVMEKINAIFCEHLVEEEQSVTSSPQVDLQVTEVLRQAELTTAAKLKHCLAVRWQQQRVIENLCVVNECAEDELENEVADLKLRAEYYEAKWREARENTKQLQFQVDRLTVMVKKMGNPRRSRAILSSESTEDETDKEMDSTYGEQCNHNEPKSFLRKNGERIELQDRQKPSTSCAQTLIQKRSSRMRRRNSSSDTPQQSDTGAFAKRNHRVSVKCEEQFTMKDFMLAATVPEVKPYHGKPTESFKRFLKSFLMKYPRTHWDDTRLIQLLEGFLRKDALTIFETLPRRVKEGSFDELIRAMKERLDEEGNVACVKALTSLRTLTMRDNQTVSDFCYVLEEIASQAYPDETMGRVSLQMAEILYSQLSKWSGSYILAETIETSPRDRVYERVKEAALRLERNLQRVKRKQDHRRYEHSKDSKERLVEIPTSSEEECEWKHSASLQKSIHKKTTPGRSGAKRCFSCGVLGHIARDCRSKPEDDTSEKTQKEVSSFSTALESWLCTVASEQPRNVNLFFGEKLLIPVRTMGMRTQALVDTGSETSIAPLSLFKRAKETGVDVDTFVDRVPNMTKVNVRDASGNKIEILDSIKLRVEMYGRVENIPMHVSKSCGDVIILGTNVLQSLGFKLTRGDASENLLSRKRDKGTSVQGAKRNRKPETDRKISAAHVEGMSASVPCTRNKGSDKAEKLKRKIREKERPNERYSNTGTFHCRATANALDNPRLKCSHKCHGRSQNTEDEAAIGSAYTARSMVVSKDSSVPSVSEAALAVGIIARKLVSASHPVTSATGWDFYTKSQEFAKEKMTMVPFNKLQKNKEEDGKSEEPGTDHYHGGYQYDNPQHGRGRRGRYRMVNGRGQPF